MKPVGFRDIHLDFHTHGDIPDIGADFDGEEFAQTLLDAHVDSICVFARCHHGYCCYPAKVGTPHPQLVKPDLLGEMVTALRAHDISVGLYTTVVWDELTWQNHPEWRVVKPDGKFAMDGGPSWKWLCMNTGYADWLEEHTREVLEGYQVDRVLFDIIMPWADGCICDDCLAGMKVEQLDPAVADDRKLFAQRVRSRFIERFSELCAELQPGVPCFFNRPWPLSSHPEMSARRDLEQYGYLVIESLPSGAWGYNHFPLLAAYFGHRGLDVASHTGRFHRMWGDFGGLKNEAALQYECLRQAAWGVKGGIGDQLHPRGRLEPAAYDLVGQAYALVEQLQPWIADTEPLAEVGIVIAAGTGPDGFNDLDNRSEEGAMRVCLELGVPFLIVDTEDEFDRFEVLLLPDRLYLDEALVAKLNAFVEGGGRLLATHRSGLAPDAHGFALPAWPAQWLGETDQTAHYLRPLAAAGPGLADYDYVVYERGAKVEPKDDAVTLARRVPSYFERRAQHFCSHAQTPPTREPHGPAGVENRQVSYFTDPLFRLYRETGHGVYKQLLRNALSRLNPRPLVRHNLPSTAELTLRSQGANTLLHILHYVPQRRANIDIVEDVLPLVDIEVAVRLEQEPTAVKLVPSLEPVEFTWRDGYAQVRLPRIDGHVHLIFEA